MLFILTPSVIQKMQSLIPLLQKWIKMIKYVICSTKKFTLEERIHLRNGNFSYLSLVVEQYWKFLLFGPLINYSVFFKYPYE